MGTVIYVKEQHNSILGIPLYMVGLLIVHMILLVSAHSSLSTSPHNQNCRKVKMQAAATETSEYVRSLHQCSQSVLEHPCRVSGAFESA